MEIIAGNAVGITEVPTAAPQSAPTDAPAPTISPVAAPIGGALESPPELEWELDEASGMFVGKVEVGVVTLDNFWGVTTTRGFNGQVCWVLSFGVVCFHFCCCCCCW